MERGLQALSARIVVRLHGAQRALLQRQALLGPLRGLPGCQQLRQSLLRGLPAIHTQILLDSLQVTN